MVRMEYLESVEVISVGTPSGRNVVASVVDGLFHIGFSPFLGGDLDLPALMVGLYPVNAIDLFRRIGDVLFATRTGHAADLEFKLFHGFTHISFRE
jgi:hypothetical protein